MQIKQIYQQLTAAMPNCRVRPSQLQMVEEIDSCMSQADSEVKDGHNLCLIEAPTGTGKSLAYLMAGIVNAKKLGKKLIISTATKTLQSQLVEKDIPAFIKYSGIKFSYGLAKGRGNYLCPYQLELSAQGIIGDLFAETTKTKDELTEIYQIFAQKAWDGDLDQAPLHFDNKLKVLITTDKDRCIGYNCTYNQKDESNCPFYLNREKLKSCDVIVTNHSLLLADLMLGGGSVLPVKPSDYLLCLDEGHTFVDSAVNSFTQMFELKQAIGSCQNLAKLIYNPQTQSYIFNDIPLCDELFGKANDLVATLDEFLFLLTQNLPLFTEKRLILNDYLNPNINSDFRDRFVGFAYIAGELSTGLTNITEKLKEQLKNNPDYLIEANLNKLGFYTSMINRILLTSQYVINQDDSRYNANAKWIELKSIKGNDEFVIFAGLTHVGNVLFNNLWSKVH
ncbi:MAG: DEAD/DEAH box helicase, partial [Burkholderiales bacterium]